jgi:hypothetical protein
LLAKGRIVARTLRAFRELSSDRASGQAVSGDEPIVAVADEEDARWLRDGALSAGVRLEPVIVQSFEQGLVHLVQSLYRPTSGGTSAQPAPRTAASASARVLARQALILMASEVAHRSEGARLDETPALALFAIELPPATPDGVAAEFDWALAEAAADAASTSGWRPGYPLGAMLVGAHIVPETHDVPQTHLQDLVKRGPDGRDITREEAEWKAIANDLRYGRCLLVVSDLEAYLAPRTVNEAYGLLARCRELAQRIAFRATGALRFLESDEAAGVYRIDLGDVDQSGAP